MEQVLVKINNILFNRVYFSFYNEVVRKEYFFMIDMKIEVMIGV